VTVNSALICGNETSKCTSARSMHTVHWFTDFVIFRFVIRLHENGHMSGRNIWRNTMFIIQYSIIHLCAFFRYNIKLLSAGHGLFKICSSLLSIALISTLECISSLNVQQKDTVIFRTQLYLTYCNVGGKLYAVVGNFRTRLEECNDCMPG
jgi:hypothetical protein